VFGFLSPRKAKSPGGTAAGRRRPAPGATARERARIPFDLLRKVRRIEIATNRLVDQGVAGDYHSVFKGRGMEFAEVRPYQPGDDVRGIDWNVTARMGTPFVKQYVEERDLTIFLVVDVSGSLSFGSRAILKRELAAEVAALLAFAAGFLVRPFGAIVFGRIGDIVGRKYTFLVTIMIMGLSTFIVGLLPNAATIGFAATAVVKRSDFGINFGVPIISDRVDLAINAAFEAE